MILATVLLGFASYALFYAAAPGRHGAVRRRLPRRAGLAAGALCLAAASVCGALVWGGVVTGVLVALSAALAAASVLVIAAPLLDRSGS